MGGGGGGGKPHGALLLLLILFFVLPFALSLRDHDGLLPLVVDFSEHYYYLSLTEKMNEAMSVNNCSMGGDVTIAGSASSSSSSPSFDFRVQVITPASDVLEKWSTMRFNDGVAVDRARNENQTIGAAAGAAGGLRQFIQVAPSLCKSEAFIGYKQGHFRRSKGCVAMIQNGLKIVNTYGATLHPDHARCDLRPAINACKEASIRPTLLHSPAEKRALLQYPFLITVEQNIISKGGMVALPCGPLGLYSSCEAVNWGLPTASEVVANTQACRKSLLLSAQGTNVLGGGEEGDSHCVFRVFEEVFVMSQYDDTQIGQFVLESLPRLIYHLPMILSKPDMKIHFGFTKAPVLASFALPHMFFRWLGLEQRLINGTVFAKKTYLPREGGCQDPGYNMWELFTMRKTFLALAEKQIGLGGRNNSKGWPSYRKTENLLRLDVDFDMDVPPSSSLGGSKGEGGSASLRGREKRPVLVMIKRSASPYTQNQADYRRRRWPSQKGITGMTGANQVLKALSKAFPSHDVKIFSDIDVDMMSCVPCQVQLFSTADIVVGIHGAGLTNTLYMKPGGVVIEVVYALLIFLDKCLKTRKTPTHRKISHKTLQHMHSRTNFAL